MDIQIDGKTIVRDLVVRYPQARSVLESLGIDYCCGGRHSLADAAGEAKVDLATALDAVRRAVAGVVPAAPSHQEDWATASLTKLADHIVARHHVFMKRELPRIEDFFGKVRKAHAERHGAMLDGLHGVFSGLRAEIEMHLVKEERILFPGIQHMEAEIRAGETLTPMHCGSVRNPIGQMEREHESAGVALARMREMTDGYALPADACPTFTALYESLQAMESDLHEHIHLENNILFPRAIAMEESASRG